MKNSSQKSYKEQPVSKTYCDRLYTELHIEEDGSVTPCCVMPSNRFPMGSNLKEYISGKPLKELRKALDSGIQHKNCEWCWKNEAAGLKTHRVSTPRKRELDSIHIRLNNVCNFKCRMCNPSFSSTWAVENKKHNYFVFEDNAVFKDAIEHNGDYLFDMLKSGIESGSLKHISLSGGEPLITDSHIKLMNFLLDNDLVNVSLGYSTNLSNLNYKGFDCVVAWEQFRSVSVEASVDGWGDAVEYSRTGFNMKTFLDNFKEAHRYVDTINCVVSIYSIWTLPIIERFRKQGIKIIYSPCRLPIHCNPQILMREDKQKLFNLYSDYPALLDIFKKFIDIDLENGYTQSDPNGLVKHNTLDDIRKEMISYNLLLDKYRDTNFFEVFPMYEKYKEI